MRQIALGAMIGVVAIFSLLAAATANGLLEYRFNTFSESAAGKVFITQETVDTINSLYGEKEFSACLEVEQETQIKGYNIDIKYVITGITDVRQGGYDYSINKFCEYGTVHSHPQKTPFFSLADIMSFKERIKKGEILAVVIYDVDRLNYITRNDFEEKPLIVS